MPLNGIRRALRVCFMANKVGAMWGLRGFGKSTLVRDSVPEGWGFYDYRLSDKEASDLGGIPFPIEREVMVWRETAGNPAKLTQVKETRRVVEYLMTTQLPFDTDERCVINFDEADRTSDLSVQNVMLQLTLDRQINGHRLSKNARIVLCGNGATDVGTTSLSDALAGRACHFYVDTDSEAALNSWLDWAADNTVSGGLQSFAKHNHDVWTSAKGAGDLEEYGSPTPRTFVCADELYSVCKAAQEAHNDSNGKKGFITEDLILPIIAGCVGQSSALKLIAWYRICEAVPTIDEICNSPLKCKLPEASDPKDTLGIYFCLGMTLARYVKSAGNGKIDALAAYVTRWPREQARFTFTHMIRNQPVIATSPAFMKWDKSV